MNSRKLFTVYLLCLILIPTIAIPFCNAQERIVQLSTQEGEFTRDFFNVMRTSIKFNGIGVDQDAEPGSETWFIEDPNLPFLPLVVSIGDPYQINTTHVGVVEQQIGVKQEDGSIETGLYTIYEWNIVYKYDIVMYTLADDRIIEGESHTKHGWLYHEGWGLNDWKWKKQDKSDAAKWAGALGYETGALWSGVQDHVELFFENYDLTTWYNQSPSDPLNPVDELAEFGNPLKDLTAWQWKGALSYEVELDPRYIFPQNVTIEDGLWSYDSFYAGFTHCLLKDGEGDVGENFSVVVDGFVVDPGNIDDDYSPPQPSEYDAENSEGGASLGASSIGGYDHLMDHADAYYKQFVPYIEALPWSANLPPDGSPAVMLKVSSGEGVVVPPNFDPNALQILDQQRRVKMIFTGFELRPYVGIVGGTHHWHSYDMYNGLLNGAEWLFPPLGFWGGEGTGTDMAIDVVLDWYVKNSFIKMTVETGVRVSTLYKWEGMVEPNIHRPRGSPLSRPNFNGGDLLIHAGLQGGLAAEAPPSFFEKFWWVIVIVAIVALGWLVGKVRGGRRKKVTKEYHEKEIVREHVVTPEQLQYNRDENRPYTDEKVR
jgi:hypothetical protein